MQAKLQRLSLLTFLLISYTLLVVILSTPSFTWSSLTHAAPATSRLLAHLAQTRITHQERPPSSAPNSKAVQFSCQKDDQPQPILCYGPYQIRQAYGVTSLLDQDITGQGSTITIIDAYGSPTIRQDLHAFDTQWGLTDPSLHVLTPYGVQGSSTSASWEPEVSMDVEWAHVIAPQAAINLIVAKSSNNTDLYHALKYAVEQNLGDVISLSFGENESCVNSKMRSAVHQMLSRAMQQHITVVAATGDTGSAQYTCNNAALQQAISFPADDPLITAVGGTTLHADAVTGQYQSEVAWNEADTFSKASGGGFSVWYARPSYQHTIPDQTTGRAIPDLALNASINGGVLVYQSQTDAQRSPISIIGGTSVGTPEMAGLIADGVQMAGHRLGFLNPTLYQLGSHSRYPQTMHDIRSGNNILSPSVPGYTARQGWDAVTGWGSPRSAELFLRALISSPTS